MENIRKSSTVLKIHNGTVRSDVNMCNTCRHAHITVGSLTGKEQYRCTFDHTIYLSEPMAKCNKYLDNRVPTLIDMQGIAWQLMTDKGGRSIGFLSPDKVREMER